MHDAAHVEELVAYLRGDLSGAMGLRSWLGSMSDYGGQVASYGTPPEPSGGALAAARTANRVQDALDALTVEHRAVLAAWAAPRGVGAPKDRVVERAGGRRERVEALRGSVRILGAAYAVACRIEPLERLHDLGRAASGPKGEARTAAERELRRVSGRAQRVVREALDAYTEARRARRGRRRRQQVERFARSMQPR